MKKIIAYCSVSGFMILVAVFAAGCHKNNLKVNVSDIQTNISVIRFEKELFSADPSRLDEQVIKWKKEYGRFFDDFCYVTHLGNSNSQDFNERLKSFLTDYNNYRVYKRTMEVFPDLDKVTKDLNNAFSHYRYYFPEKPIPEVYSFISGISQSAITDDSILAIGLDRYLGSKEQLYREAGIYNYLIVNMYPEKMVADCMGFWSETEFTYNDSINNLISNMIYQGRLLYFVKAMMPDQADTINLGFTGKQLDYLAKYEKSMWAFLIEHKLLFNADRFTIDKYILEGPFTHDFGRGSPAKAAVWIGYRIVESYMAKNPDVTFQKLMNEKNYMTILNQSGYNP